MNPLAPVQTQRQQAHAQHNGHCLDQHLDEFVDRTGHRARLVLDLRQLHTRRQGGVQLPDGHRQRLAQGNDVAPFGHGHAQRYDLMAIVTYLSTTGGST